MYDLNNINTIDKILVSFIKFILQISHKWDILGDMLKVPDSILASIRRDTSIGGDSILSIRQVFIKWSQSRSSPYNWGTLLSALSTETVGERGLAEEIAKRLKDRSV